MRVKIGDKFYDSLEEPIMLFLSEEEKMDIENMLPHEDKMRISTAPFEFSSKYCSYPKYWGRFEEETKELIERFMATKPKVEDINGEMLTPTPWCGQPMKTYFEECQTCPLRSSNCASGGCVRIMWETK